MRTGSAGRTAVAASPRRASLREPIRRRRVQEEFIARGLRSREDAESSGIHRSAESVYSELQRRLDARRKSTLG